MENLSGRKNILSRPSASRFAGLLGDKVRHQPKKEGINNGWREIVRTMNTQKAVTTLAQNDID